MKGFRKLSSIAVLLFAFVSPPSLAEAKDISLSNVLNEQSVAPDANLVGNKNRRAFDCSTVVKKIPEQTTADNPTTAALRTIPENPTTAAALRTIRENPTTAAALRTIRENPTTAAFWRRPDYRTTAALRTIPDYPPTLLEIGVKTT